MCDSKCTPNLTARPDKSFEIVPRGWRRRGGGRRRSRRRRLVDITTVLGREGETWNGRRGLQEYKYGSCNWGWPSCLWPD